MTRPLSDAQLDALAAAPREQRTLPATLARHRKLYRQDAWIERLTTETPPATVDPATGELGKTWMSQIGPTLSARLERYVSYRVEDNGEMVESRPAATPWASAFRALRQMCRGVHHAHQERSEWRGSLCYAMVSLTVIGDLSVDAACVKLGVTGQRAGLTLRTALLWLEAEMDRQRQRMIDRERAVEGARMAREDAGYVAIPVHQHMPLDGLHAQECSNVVCRKSRAA